MNLPAAFFPNWLLLICAIMGLLICVWAVKREKWQQLSQAEINSWLACSVIVLMIWQLKAQIYAGLTFHILGVAALTLIAGPNRTLLSIATLVGLHLSFGSGDIRSWGLSFLLVGALPVLSTQAILHFAQRQFSPNLFVYIFVNCFAAGAISMWLFGLVNSTLLLFFNAYPASFLIDDALPVYFLMGWPEAFITGLNLTLLIVWRPEWVSSFNDRVYLQKR